MATNVAGRRYRTWYAMLLRLYPRPFRERFGEGMAQTFTTYAASTGTPSGDCAGSRCGSSRR